MRFLLLVMLFVWAVALSGASEWRIVPPSRGEALHVSLPPLAVVEERDESGKTWRLTGKMAGGLSVARRDFQMALERQGWRLDKVIPLGREKRAAELFLWKKDKQSIMVMLSEERAGRSRFAVGMEK